MASHQPLPTGLVSRSPVCLSNWIPRSNRMTTKNPARKSVTDRSAVYREIETNYLYHLPRQPIPGGRFLVHNHIKPASPLGSNGFRAWTQNTSSRLVECHCDFGGCKNADLHKHYRV